MTNEEVKRMMEQVDEKYIDELTKYDASAQPDEPAEIVSGETPIVKSSPWRAVAAIAAAVLLIVPGVYLTKQASLHMTPSESVSDSMPTEEWENSLFDGTLDVLPGLPEETSQILSESSGGPLTFGSFLGNATVTASGCSEDVNDAAIANVAYQDGDRSLVLTVIDHTTDMLPATPGKSLGGQYENVTFHGKIADDGSACAFWQGDTQYLITADHLTAHELVTFTYEVLAAHPTAFMLHMHNTQGSGWFEGDAAVIPFEENRFDAPVIQLESCSDMQRGQVSSSTGTGENGEVYEKLNIVYSIPDAPWHRLHIGYVQMPEGGADSLMPFAANDRIMLTPETCEMLDNDTIWNSIWMRNGNVCFTLDCGTYCVNVAGEGCSYEELVGFMAALFRPDGEQTSDGRSTMEPQDFATLADANRAAFPWQGKVIQWDVIGEKAVDYIHTSGDDLEILYADNDPMSNYIRLHYEQLGEKPADGTHVKPENGKLDADALFGDMEMYIADDTLSFYVDYPDYSLFLSMEADRDEFGYLIHALNAVNAESVMSEQDTVSEDVQHYTYEEALDFVGSAYLPARVMGSEEMGTLMTLDESEILHGRKILRGADGSESETEYLELNYYSSEHHLKLIIGDANYITDQPEIQSWSMKDITKAPAAETVEGSLQNYSFYRKAGELTIAFEGTVTMDEIDAFAQFYSNISYSQETGYVFPNFMSLDEVNKQNTIWNTQVPELEQIGSYTFREADLYEFANVSHRQVKRQNLYYDYTPGAAEDLKFPRCLTISYTDMTAEELGCSALTVGLDKLDAGTLCTDDRFLVHEDDQNRAFVVEMGSYNIIVVAEGGIAQEDMQAVIDAIRSTSKINTLLDTDTLNKAGCVWDGNVPTAQTIGGYRFDSAMLQKGIDPAANESYTQEVLMYQPGDTDSYGMFTVVYTTQSAGDTGYAECVIDRNVLNAETVCTQERFVCNSRRVFLLDMGDYRIRVSCTRTDIPQTDMQAFIDAILEANK